MAETIIIKKYANRRLYNTQTSTYVTLDSLAEMVRIGQEFEVVDAKTGEDITRVVLAQIIFDEESKDESSLLPTNFLKELIRFYNQSLEKMLPPYLEMAIKSFSPHGHTMGSGADIGAETGKTDKTGKTSNTETDANGFDPFGSIQDITRRNVDMFNQTMQMFSPFGFTAAQPKTKDEEIADLKAELTKLKKEQATAQR